jgi:hypothetical protein
MWTRITDATPGYRYLKIEITRETGGYAKGQMIINEIRFFEGILAQEEEVPRSFFKMKTPRFPSHQMVACSSFIDQLHHCYRAFDGDDGGAGWVTQPVGIN